MDSTAKTDNRQTVTLLSLSPLEEDHLALEHIFQSSEATLYPGLRVAVARAWESGNAVETVQASRIPIVICDADQMADEWQLVALELRRVPETPCLILASSVRDDCFSAEALKQGVYDVLTKPLRATEVLRITKMAWLRWQHRYHVHNPEPETLSGASAEVETGRITKEKP